MNHNMISFRFHGVYFYLVGEEKKNRNKIPNPREYVRAILNCFLNCNQVFDLSLHYGRQERGRLKSLSEK